MSTSGCPGSPATKRANAGLGLACCEVSCEVAKLLGENQVTKRSVGSSQLSPASLGCCQTGGWVGRIAAQVRLFLVAAEWGGTQGDPKDGARALVWAPRRHTALLAVWQGSSYRAEQDSLLTYPLCPAGNTVWRRFRLVGCRRDTSSRWGNAFISAHPSMGVAGWVGWHGAAITHCARTGVFLEDESFHLL